ncbi:ABC transporter ATP-binding protein [Aeromicrobium sp. 179-A 4D2 NHS]
MVTLDAHVVEATRDVDVRLVLESGETLALLGPNGAGKSTVLSVVAGLLRPQDGRVLAGERAWFAGRTWLPPHRRSVGLLAQEPRLFPHLTVRENVAFGPRSRGTDDPGRVASAWMERAGVDALADRRPRELSGGQAQRVAIARALATEPEVVLLDEPLAALDAEAVPEVRRLLREVLADRTAVVVTHEPLDALTLADRVAVLEAGRIVQEGTAADVLARPRSAFGAALSGVNLLTGTVVAPDRLRTPDGREVTGLATLPLETGSRATATFSPAAVALHRTRPSGSPRNVLPGEVEAVELRAGTCRVVVSGWLADVTTDSVTELGLEPGAAVWLSLKATEVRLEPA